MIGGAGTTSQLTLIEAAKAAGVKRFLPSEWGFQLSKLGWDSHGSLLGSSAEYDGHGCLTCGSCRRLNVNAHVRARRRGYMPLTDAKFDVREALETSGLEWTLVESGMFTESQFDAWIGFDWDNGKVLIR